MLTHEQLLQAIPDALQCVDLPNLGAKTEGKVREIYSLDDQRILITTDRISAFDRVLGTIPYKGQVLNQLSAWWFAQTKHIVDNHFVAMPDPNVTIAREARPLPVEIVVRGYITGVTKTSLWTLYESGERHPYGITLPEGLRKNDPLPMPVITPTTKAPAGEHDELLTRQQILDRGLVTQAVWEQVETEALALFKYGQEIAQRGGLILVDTKYEFGIIDGRPVLIDEIHTPDSSRFWVLSSYQPRRGPDNFDKEYLREWFAAQGYRGDGTPPTMPDDFIVRVAARYIAAYEQLTGETFIPGEQPTRERIARNVGIYLQAGSRESK